jgi:hypothetical protein
MKQKCSIKNLMLKIQLQKVSKVKPLSAKEKKELKERILLEIQKKAFC